MKHLSDQIPVGSANSLSILPEKSAPAMRFREHSDSLLLCVLCFLFGIILPSLTFAQESPIQANAGAPASPNGIRGESPSPDLTPLPIVFPSFSELEDRVEALRIEDIAWRKIDWKLCILEGLQASREEGKPVLFWCHIDLPADDKRC
ncbi:MAG: hypothetical protein AAF191_19955 [Verrucomicrobiota bacterium]